MANTCTVANEGKNLLPKLPLPNINETMEKYLDSVVAFISPHDYKRTKTHVEAFLSNEADLKKIDAFLAKRNMETQNWVILLFQKLMMFSITLSYIFIFSIDFDPIYFRHIGGGWKICI